MRSQCIAAAAQAMGRALTATEVQGIETRVTRAMRTLAREDPSAWQAKSTADRLLEAGEFAAQELIAAANLKRARLALQVAATQRVGQSIADMQKLGVTGLNALDRLIAFHPDGRSNALSIESMSKAIERDALRQMLGTLEASNPKWFGLFENRDGVQAIVREIFGEPSGNTDARAGAEQWKTISESLRQRFNRAGGDVGQLEDWGMPHHHSQPLVAKAGREQWVADTLPKLDRSKYLNEDGSTMGEGQLGDFLREAWTSIATGGANKLTPGQFRGGGMRANRGNESRQIHFKSADDYLAYQDVYGERTLYEVLIGHIAGISKDIALVERFGPNPDHAFRYFRDSAVQEAKITDPTKVGKIDQAAIRSENLYNVVAGRTQPVASQWLADTFDTLRSWLVASRLGSAVITSFSDEATLYLTAHVNNLPAVKVFANELAALNPANRAEKRMALRAGLSLNTLISSLNRFGQDGLGKSFSHKLATTVLRASGLNALTEARRRAFGVTMMGAIGDVTQTHAKLTDLDAADNRLLLSKGITETDFAVWRKAALEDWGGGNDTMLTPEAIYRIPDTELAALGDPVALRETAATRLLGVVLEESDMAVIEPGVVERSFMGATLQRGTWKGELMRSVFLFKSFPLSMLTRHWSRGMSMPNAGGRAGYISTLIAGTTVLGMLSLQVNEVLNGRDPRRMFGEGSMRTWIAAMLKGGSLGIYGDFLLSERSQYGRSLVTDITGPVAGLVDEVDRLTRGNIIQAMSGEETDIGAETVRFARSNLPGANLWYTKAALDHLIFHQLQEYFSPGYLARMRRRSEREFGQRFWWEPGEVAPTRAPDLEAVVEE